MHRHEDTRKVQHGGQNRLQGNLTVGNLHIVRHQEGGGAHDGGHDLTAGGSGGFRGSGKFRVIARPLHQGDGHGAGAHGIGHGGAGYHALQRAGYHRHLRRAAGQTAQQRICHIDEEIRNARALQERAEDDEHHDELGADVDGGGENALLAVEQVADDVLDLSPEGGVGKTGGKGVNQEAGRHNQNGQTHASAADLRQSQHAQNADDDLDIGELGALLDNGLGVEGKVQKRAGAHNHNHPVVPRNVIDPLVALLRREHQDADKHNPGHKGGQPQFLQPAGEQGHIQAEQGKQRQHAVHREPGLSLPEADIGFLVIFFHDRFQIHRLLRHCFFLKESHFSSSLTV